MSTYHSDFGPKSLSELDWQDLYFGRILRYADELGEYDYWLKWLTKPHTIQDLASAAKQLDEKLWERTPGHDYA